MSPEGRNEQTGLFSLGGENCISRVASAPRMAQQPVSSCLKKEEVWVLCSYCGILLLLLLLLSRFSRVRLCATPETAAHQAPLSLGFSRQEHWSGLPFPSQCIEVKSESEVAQSCLTLSDPMDCSPPGSPSMGFSRQECWSGVPLPSPSTGGLSTKDYGAPLPSLILAKIFDAPPSY